MKKNNFLISMGCLFAYVCGIKSIRSFFVLLTIFCMQFLATNNVVAQQKTISGTVTDNTGFGMPGVSVLVKGTSVGTITNSDGKYTLSAVPSKSTLVFSFVGYKSQEIAVESKSIINVVIQEDAIGMEDLVVIGYGTTTKKKMVGAISSLDSKKLEQTAFSNVGQALQGQVPGLIVQNNGGTPGSTPSISIRGGGAPLYVIDGVIASDQDFKTINSVDIESISFLKDASATAVYGSRAGNGIVLVTTKRGKDGKMKINYSFDYIIGQPTILPQMMNSYNFAIVQNVANKYDGTAPTYTDAQLEIIKNHSDLDTYPDNNWLDLTLKTFAPQSKHNLSLTGGDKKTNYFISLGYIDEGSILKEDVVNYNRYNIRSNFNTKFDEIGLEIGVNLNASLENYVEPSAGMYSIWRAINQNTDPFYRGKNTDGTLAGGGNGDNPFALISTDAGYNKTKDKFINAQLNARWQVPHVKGLKLGMMVNYRDGDGWGKLWTKNAPLYMQDGSLMVQPKPALTVDSYYNNKMYYESSASYSNNFGKHGVDATLVYNQTTSYNESVQAYRRDYISGVVDQLFAGPLEGQNNTGTAAESANAGYVFRMRYDFDFKYIIELSGRYDGNDNFAANKRWGFFPAVSLAWNVMGEEFMKSLNDNNILNILKLRASYGNIGVTDGVNRFGYIPVYNLVSSSYNIGNSLVNGYSEGNLVNPDELTWYNRSSLNYGLDFSTLNNKLSGTLEYFYYRTTGYLISPTNIYSQALGKPLPQIKSNSAQRRAGFEISMRYADKVGDFQYEIGANASLFNQLWEQKDDEDLATLKNPYTRLTQRTDFWGNAPVYNTNGLFQNESDILNGARLLSANATQYGDIKFVDNNGDGKIDDQDKRIVGLPSKPHLSYGFDFSVVYKGVFASGLVQGTGDRYMGFDNFMIIDAKRRTYEYQLNYWTPENPNALYPRISHFQSVNGNNNNNAIYPSDFYLKNAKYIRLKNLQIGYNLKESLLTNLSAISSFKVYANATNLFTISDVMDYFDPEQAVTESGVQTYGYPIQRTFSFGINIGF